MTRRRVTTVRPKTWGATSSRSSRTVLAQEGSTQPFDGYRRLLPVQGVPDMTALTMAHLDAYRHELHLLELEQMPVHWHQIRRQWPVMTARLVARDLCL